MNQFLANRQTGPGPAERQVGDAPKMALILIFAIFSGALILILLFIIVQQCLRRRLRRASLESAANASNERPPSHLTLLERAALADTGTDPESIRQLRQRRWTARHGNNGLTLDELDLVAPVRTYEMVEQRAQAREDFSTDDENGCAASCEGSAKKPNDVERSVASWDGASDDTCAVCLDDMAEGDKTRKLRCSHEFHADCIQAWVTKANRCPVCSVEPLEAAAIAKRRNARSSTRRGIDAAISQQRRRRTRGANGTYELDSDALNGAAQPGDDPDAATNSVAEEEIAEGAPVAPGAALAPGIPVSSGTRVPSPSTFAERPRDPTRAEVVVSLPDPAAAAPLRPPTLLAPATAVTVNIGGE